MDKLKEWLTKQFMIMYLDCETTGINPINDHIIQISYLLTDDNHNIINSKNYFFSIPEVTPETYLKPYLSIKKLNLLSDGREFKNAAFDLAADLKIANIIVGHNVES